tara:strand:+ start:8037 stop:8732 length:696 start_codon:yes stop_codon:yes gene_type:complete
MPNPDLLQSQKNRIFQLLESAELNPSEFQWTWDNKDYSSNPCPVLEHKFDGYYFYFCTPDSSSDVWHYKCRPGHNNPTDTGFFEGGWDEIWQRVIVWAEELKHELNQTDLWAAVAHLDFKTLSYDQDLENTPFSYAEVEQINQKLLQLKEKVNDIANKSDTPKRIVDSVMSNIQRMEESAKKGVGRIDWINQMVGLVINIAVVFSLNPELAKQFFSFVKGLFIKSLVLLTP